jgi:HEAT repeat protein
VQALGALVDLGPTEAARPTLVAALTDADVEVRRWAAINLNHKLRPAAAAARDLARALEDSDDYVRRQVIDALDKLGPAALPALGAVAAALQDSDDFVRRTAVKVLGRFGPKAKAAVPTLNRVLRDKDRKAASAAARALWRIDAKTAVGVDPVEYVQRLSDGLAEDVEPVLREYIDSLAARKDWKGLLAIADADINGSEDALGVYCRQLDAARAIALCKGYRHQSWKWEIAFASLQAHPRKLVISYVKQVADSPSAAVRCHCYSLCKAAGWDDLVDEARRDLENPEPFVTISPSPSGPLAVGDVAKEYIQSLQKK